MRTLPTITDVICKDNIDLDLGVYQGEREREEFLSLVAFEWVDIWVCILFTY
jgi:hypothetical protein